jgi:hypothetical protein
MYKIFYSDYMEEGLLLWIFNIVMIYLKWVELMCFCLVTHYDTIVAFFFIYLKII